MRGWSWVLLTGLAVAASAAGQSPTATADKPEADMDHARKLYRVRCAQCHGIKGDGKGPAARFMRPAPRDFTTGQMKFHATPMGIPASEADVYRTISRGMPGTAMPGWSGLSQEDRWQLVYYVRSFSDRFDDAAEAAPIEIPPPPPSTPSQVARGAEVYASMGCTACHGPEGHGDGPAAETVVDATGAALPPADLTRSVRFKGGSSAVDLYRTVSTGIDGTPMPGYAPMIPEADRWALVHYVRSLSGLSDAAPR